MKAPPASSAVATQVGRGNRGRDTKPELALRRQLHRRGLRYRVHAAPIPGLRYRADVVFRAKRVCVEMMGCRWHRCPICAIPDPRTNAHYWKAKLDGNVARDRRNAEALAHAGWMLVVVWEHEDASAGADRVEAVLAGR